MKTKLTEDQRVCIVEQDDQAMREIRNLILKVRTKEVTPERALRLRRNIEGNAIARWRDRVSKTGIPLPTAAVRLTQEQAL